MSIDLMPEKGNNLQEAKQWLAKKASAAEQNFIDGFRGEIRHSISQVVSGLCIWKAESWGRLVALSLFNGSVIALGIVGFWWYTGLGLVGAKVESEKPHERAGYAVGWTGRNIPRVGATLVINSVSAYTPGVTGRDEQESSSSLTTGFAGTPIATTVSNPRQPKRGKVQTLDEWMKDQGH